MARNFIQPGDTLTVIASADITSGSPVIAGDLVGIAVTSAASGEEVEVKLSGVYELPKTSAQAWTQGTKIYWSGTAATTSATDNTLMGHAAAAAANPSGFGRVRLSN